MEVEGAMPSGEAHVKLTRLDHRKTRVRVVRARLTPATRVERIDIEWPDGKKQTLTDVEANRFVAVKQN